MIFFRKMKYKLPGLLMERFSAEALKSQVEIIAFGLGHCHDETIHVEELIFPFQIASPTNVEEKGKLQSHFLGCTHFLIPSFLEICGLPPSTWISEKSSLANWKLQPCLLRSSQQVIWGSSFNCSGNPPPNRAPPALY